MDIRAQVALCLVLLAACVAPTYACTSTAECDEGFTCDTETEECVFSCSGDEECTAQFPEQANMLCDNGVCSCTPRTGECGDDGCGVLLGTCTTFANSACNETAAVCICTPYDSDTKQCSPAGDTILDGCGGTYPSCTDTIGGPNAFCSVEGFCRCTPNEGECGDDGCGGDLGDCTALVGPEATCNTGTRECECVDLAGECGDSGCGTTLGVCGGEREVCTDRVCTCPEPFEGVCGDDGCGGSLGTCNGTDECVGRQCEPCVPQCTGKECGDDGCGGECGVCTAFDNSFCSESGQCACTPRSAPNCPGECGTDGCGGDCGVCVTDKEECRVAENEHGVEVGVCVDVDAPTESPSPSPTDAASFVRASGVLVASLVGLVGLLLT